MPVLPLISDVDLLGYGKRVIDFDSQIACVATLQVICEHVGLRPGSPRHRILERARAREIWRPRPLSGAKRTSQPHSLISANDPKRHFPPQRGMPD